MQEMSNKIVSIIRFVVNAEDKIDAFLRARAMVLYHKDGVRISEVLSFI